VRHYSRSVIATDAPHRQNGPDEASSARPPSRWLPHQSCMASSAAPLHLVCIVPPSIGAGPTLSADKPQADNTATPTGCPFLDTARCRRSAPAFTCAALPIGCPSRPAHPKPSERAYKRVTTSCPNMIECIIKSTIQATKAKFILQKYYLQKLHHLQSSSPLIQAHPM
jgi:hypothetical protein